MELPIEIELEKEVRQVKIDAKSKKVNVRTTDLKQRTADAVILAVPSNVIKSGAIVFEPVLPEKMLRAINKIGNILRSATYSFGVFKVLVNQDFSSYNIYKILVYVHVI